MSSPPNLNLTCVPVCWNTETKILWVELLGSANIKIKKFSLFYVSIILLKFSNFKDNSYFVLEITEIVLLSASVLQIGNNGLIRTIFFNLYFSKYLCSVWAIQKLNRISRFQKPNYIKLLSKKETRGPRNWSYQPQIRHK